ncbi:MAG: hypothetical protein C4542_09680 [Dehalococcoidia bacterium]|nr:MAG: hypothetical protein C4542_09680 [Dehalococcoidia bacterium]
MAPRRGPGIVLPPRKSPVAAPILANKQVPFWLYSLRAAKSDSDSLKRILAAWHKKHHPDCRALQSGRPMCKALELILQGVKLAKVHKELAAQLVLSLDAEHLVRQDDEWEG